MYGYGMFLATNGIITSGGVVYTTRTQSFATATGITSPTILNALNTFDLGLISNGLDTKMKVLYPFVGGTSTTCSYNFMNTASNQITWYGGWTYSSDGITPNGTNAYGDTGFNPNISLTLNNCGFSYYSRTNRNDIIASIGVYSASNYQFYLFPRLSNDTMVSRISTTVYSGDTYTGITDSRGFFTASRNTSSYSVLFRNGTSLGNGTISSTGLPNYKFFIGALSYENRLQYPDNQQLSLNAIHEGLTNAEAATFYSLVQAFQTSLSRQV